MLKISKICSVCLIEKNVAFFGKDKCRKDGLTYRCLECRKASREKNSEKIKKQKREHYAANKERLLAEKKEIYHNNREKKLTYQLDYYYKNKDVVLEKKKMFHKQNPNYYKEFRKRFPEKVNAKENKRKAAKLQRTPPWLTEDDYWMIEQAYDISAIRTKLLGFEWHVDHIIPLQGKIVSGLHVPLNLQVIPASVNLSKSYFFEV